MFKGKKDDQPRGMEQKFDKGSLEFCVKGLHIRPHMKIISRKYMSLLQ